MEHGKRWMCQILVIHFCVKQNDGCKRNFINRKCLKIKCTIQNEELLSFKKNE